MNARTDPAHFSVQDIANENAVLTKQRDDAEARARRYFALVRNVHIANRGGNVEDLKRAARAISQLFGTPDE